ncbi:hypothetical protein PoB_005442300 [Plakobranchus ocellatus]|uniref:Myoglobin n=1 Tax=Plakobranchus ocellatus TaxID=259542 RepID=A0AAV4C8T7_9GAST|nr:hypothetical protein PoB_005442300 [Plakobranchus ocellatus]
MSSFLDAETLNTIAMLQWAQSGNSALAEKLIAAKLVGKLWETLTADQELDALRTQAIVRIAKFIKENPKASKEHIAAEIGKHITEFAQKVDAL